MESTWFNYVLEQREIFNHNRDKFLVDLCDELLVKFNHLQASGFVIVFGDNHNDLIDEVYNSLFMRYGVSNFEFTLDRDKPHEHEMVKIARQKSAIKLMILNEALFILGEVMKRKKTVNLKELNNRVYLNKNKDNLVETRRDIKRLLIDGNIDKSFKKFEKHINNQIRTLKVKKLSYITKPNEKEKEWPEYVKIGALFAQGFMKIEKGNQPKYIYKNKEFDSRSQLAEYLKNQVLRSDIAVKQYVTATLNLAENSSKTNNFYKNLTLINNTISYCEEKGIEVSADYLLLQERLKVT